MSTDGETIAEQVKQYGWVFSLLDAPDRTPSERDHERIDMANEYLLEYLIEAERSSGYSGARIPDGMIITYVSDKMADHIGTTRSNIWQWLGGHARLEHESRFESDEWVHIDEFHQQMREQDRESFREGFVEGASR